MRKLLRGIVVGAATVLALTVALAAWASTGKTPAQVASNGDYGSCYPGNEFAIGYGNYAPGDFEAYSKGKNLKGTFLDSTKKVTASWEFAQEVEGNLFTPSLEVPFPYVDGSMSGALELKIKIGGKTVKFESHCIAEAQIEDDGENPSDQIIEAELEGHVKNAPWGSGPAVASVVFSGELDQAGEGAVSAWTITIEQGVTCAEEENSIKVTGTGGRGKMEMAPQLALGEQRGRAGLPDGYTAGPNPCEGVYF